MVRSCPGTGGHTRATGLSPAQNAMEWVSTAHSGRRSLTAVRSAGARRQDLALGRCSGPALVPAGRLAGGGSRQVRKGCMSRNVGYRGAWIMRPCIQRFATCSPCELAEICHLLFLKPAAAAGRCSAFGTATCCARRVCGPLADRADWNRHLNYIALGSERAAARGRVCVERYRVDWGRWLLLIY